MKKIFALFGAALLLVTGCRGGNGGDLEDDVEEPWAADVGTDPIKFFVSGQSHELGIYKKMIDAFEATTGIKVDQQLVPSDGYAAALQASIGTKEAPDIFYANPSSIGSYANNGLIRSLKPYLDEAINYTFEIKDKNGNVTKEEKLDYNNFLDGLLDFYKYSTSKQERGIGKTWAIPKDISNYPLAYNRVIIEKSIEKGLWPADLPKPWDIDAKTGKQISYTWEQFNRACVATTFPADGGSGRYVGTALIDTWAMHSWIWTAGGDWLSADGTKVTVDTPAFIDGLNEFVQLMDWRNVSQTRDEMNAKPHYDRWMAGQVAFFNVGVWDVAAFEGVDKLKLNYGLMPTPRKDANSEWYAYIGSVGYAISKYSKRPNAATLLALWMSISEESYNRQTKYNTIQLPNSKIWMADYLADETIRPEGKEIFIEVINGHGRLHPTAIAYDDLWYQAFTTELGKVWKETDEATTTEMTVAQYVKYIQPTMQKRLDEALQNQKDRF